ncbi:MAG: hypothetical protein GVY24_08035 [Planctomycetes bacterium]|jgi:hypothetical protein|nr:hypothetical protein [Planctomycetota bacterium]
MKRPTGMSDKAWQLLLLEERKRVAEGRTRSADISRGFVSEELVRAAATYWYGPRPYLDEQACAERRLTQGERPWPQEKTG